MTPQTPPGADPVVAGRSPGSSRKRTLWRWVLLGATVLTLAGAATAAWWGLAAPAPPAPPMPADIREPEVQAALQAVRQEVLDHPRSGQAWGRLGMVFLAHLFDHEATFCFTEAARLDPTDPRWPYGRAVIALKRDPDNAIPLLRQAAAAADALPDHPPVYRLQLAESLLERGQRDEAEAIFMEAKRRDPTDLRAALGLGMCAQARGDDRTAETFLSEARASPNARKAATAQLAVLARARRDDAAAAAYEKEIADLPEDPPWPDSFRDRVIELLVGRRQRERQITQLERDHRYAEAADMYLAQIQDKPTAVAYIGAGVNLARAGDYDQAFPILRQAVRFDPDNAQTHYALALTLFTRAEEQAQSSPGSAELNDWFSEAAEHARRAAEIKPDFAKAYLFWGLSLRHLGKTGDAVGPLRKGVECRPEEFELQLGLGEALLDLGQGKEAKAYLDNAQRLDPKDPRPARALERMHKKDG